ncbi:GBS Bsp-like repeat-containing protein, partial [Lactococcus hodotermopsidis]|uniref:GBS Bsp-like repeat-containing protein n=1 Tax=Pseudolactococcus hodotermopsidis TaxID=2709157 RepID=UPI0015580862
MRVRNKILFVSVFILIQGGVAVEVTQASSAVNDYIIKNKVTPASETLSLGKIYNQDSSKNGGINMDYVGGKPKMVIIHEVGVDGGSITGSIDYMVRTQDSAFVHAFVDANQLITIADTKKKAWGSGPYGNQYGIQIEQMRVTTNAAFYKQIATLAKWTADQMKKYNMGAPKLMSAPSIVSHNPSAPLDGNLATHKMISYKWGGTDHVDPDAYWARFGYNIDQFRDLVVYYYGNATPTKITSAVIEGTPSTGKFDVRIKATGDISSLKVPIWSDKNGQDDLVWYEAKKVASGEYVASFNVSNHSNQSGSYHVQAFAFGSSGNILTSASINEKLQVGTQAVKITSTAIEGTPSTGKFDVRIKATGDISSLKVPIWSDKNGQDDLVWYEA